VQRIDAGIGNLVPPAIKADVLVGPHDPHHGYLFFGAFTPIMEILGQDLELYIVPPDADAQAQMSAAGRQ
jgi:hypothetical protein